MMSMSMWILLVWVAPPLNATTTAAWIRVPMLLQLLQGLRNALHPCIGSRLALGNEEA
jgi:hypothetical protein